jgi:hypothetical protein
MRTEPSTHNVRMTDACKGRGGFETACRAQSLYCAVSKASFHRCGVVGAQRGWRNKAIAPYVCECRLGFKKQNCHQALDRK